MKEKYKTILDSHWTKLTIKESRFFSCIYRIKTKDEIDILLERVIRKFKKPTHIVYAYRIFQDNKLQEYCTDSGEPPQTSGPPILKVLKGNELFNVIIIVVRFFGGIKLGMGGLIKAYTKSAQQAIKKSKIIIKTNYSLVKIDTIYNNLGGIIHKIKKSGGKIKKIDYGKNVTINAKIPVSEIKNFNLNK